MKLIKRTLVVSAVIFLLFSGLPAGAETSATDQLKASVDQILDVLRDSGLKADAQKEVRRKKLRAIAGQRFDYNRMAQLSLARHWRGRSDGEKEEFTRLFSSLLEDAYMSKIESYTDEKVVYLNERIKKKKKKEYAKISTKIITQTTEIPINYMMYRTGQDPWLVYDMVIEGVSMVKNYRTQFRQILSKDSPEKLLEILRDKVGKG